MLSKKRVDKMFRPLPLCGMLGRGEIRCVHKNLGLPSFTVHTNNWPSRSIDSHSKRGWIRRTGGGSEGRGRMRGDGYAGAVVAVMFSVVVLYADEDGIAHR